jgi:hypothetical protein
MPATSAPQAWHGSTTCGTQARIDHKEPRVQLFFAAALLLSAALLFVVEPMFAKMVLRLLGGSPSVWNTCLVFYQAALLAGYLYAHLSVKWLGPRRQALVHLGLLCLPWLVLPIGLAHDAAPRPESNPVPWLLLMLTFSVGLPFICVSATAPLLQAWFADTDHRSAKDPYFLYAASNLGSMIGLASYPLLIESHWTLVEQARWWAIGYGLLMALVAASAAWLWLSRRPAAEEAVESEEWGVESEQDDVDSQTAAPSPGTRAGARQPSTLRADTATLHCPPTLARRLRWLALATVPSSLLLGVTAHLSTDIAAVPLLWVIPLALYLLSFVLVFARWQVLSLRWMTWLQAGGLAFLAAMFYLGGLRTSQIILAGSLHLIVFFFTCMVCHGQLAADRPASRYLTEFYLWLSVGGVLGGLFAALVAPPLSNMILEAYQWLEVFGRWGNLLRMLLVPAMFNVVFEYPLMILLACLLRPAPAGRGTQGREWFETAVMLVLGVLFVITAWGLSSATVSRAMVRIWLVAGAALCAFLLQRRPTRFTLAVALVMTVSALCSGEKSPLYRARSFFGVLKVDLDKEDNAHRLLHGSTLHGTQSLDAEESLEPWTYYHRTGPVGDVFDELEDRESFRKRGRIGVVGLGTGSVAAYGRPGQRLTYFEIDPTVVRISRDLGYFSYLRNCKADWDIRLGDARLTLAREPDGQFDVLLIDAFSSDAIPLHLLTREAVEMYFQKLAPRGLLMVHISNRHLNLEPVLGNLAADLGVVARVRCDEDESYDGKCASTWILLCRDEKDLGGLGTDDDWGAVETDSHRAWTDDFSNIVSVMDWHFSWKRLPGWKWWHRTPVAIWAIIVPLLLAVVAAFKAVRFFRMARAVGSTHADAEPRRDEK